MRMRKITTNYTVFFIVFVNLAISDKLLSRNPHAADKEAASVKRIIIIAFYMAGSIFWCSIVIVYHYTEHLGVLKNLIKACPCVQLVPRDHQIY